MIRRRFYSSYKSPVDNGVYAVKQDGRLIPLSKADYQCISVAIVHDDHKIMIEKNEDSNQSYKTATSGLPDSSNKTYSFYWGEYGTDQTGITNYDKVDGSNDFGFLKPEQDSYKGTPYLPDDVSSWTNGALSDWDGKANSEVLKNVLSGGQSQNSHPTIGCMLNAFIDSSDAKGLDDWYIPSCSQLALIFMNLYSVDNALSAIGGLQIGNDKVYWSSSERNTEEAWNLSTKYLHVSYDNKNMAAMVRFIRDI